MLCIVFLSFYRSCLSWTSPTNQTMRERKRIGRMKYLLGSLLLLLLLGLSLILLYRSFLNRRRWCFFLLLLFLDGNKKSNNILGLDHVVFINLKFTEDIINLSLGHLVSPGHESMGEHLGVNLALL